MVARTWTRVIEYIFVVVALYESAYVMKRHLARRSNPVAIGAKRRRARLGLADDGILDRALPDSAANWECCCAPDRCRSDRRQAGGAMREIG